VGGWACKEKLRIEEVKGENREGSIDKGEKKRKQETR